MSRIRIWTVLLAAIACGNAHAISNPNGLLTASTTADLDAAAEGGNLVFGRGMLKWTGGDAAWTGGVTLAMPDNTELTVNVTDPNATLTINGATAQAGSGLLDPNTVDLIIDVPGQPGNDEVVPIDLLGHCDGACTVIKALVDPGFIQQQQVVDQLREMRINLFKAGILHQQFHKRGQLSDFLLRQLLVGGKHGFDERINDFAVFAGQFADP